MISVIVPVYNTEHTLRRCIDLVLNSTYGDFELILVNDGSTDNSPVLCQAYCGQDSRVRMGSTTYRFVPGLLESFSILQNRQSAKTDDAWLFQTAVLPDGEGYLQGVFLLYRTDWQKTGKEYRSQVIAHI